MSSLERDVREGRARIGPDGEPYQVTSWATVDLEPVKRGERTSSGPAFLTRSDGKALIYPGRPHVFYGPSESLKTWAALLACKSFLDGGFTALYVDFEADEETFVERARIVGIPDGAIGRTVQYVRPDDAAQFQKLFNRFADGTASIVIDHSGKDAGRGVIGSQHKRAGPNGAEYAFTPKQRRGRGGHSVAEIEVTKDRHGYVREFAPDGKIGRLHVSGAKVEIVAPDPNNKAASGGDAPLRADILKWVEAHPGQSGKAVAKGVQRDEKAVNAELRGLEVDGRVRHEDGPRSANLWFLPA